MSDTPIALAIISVNEPLAVEVADKVADALDVHRMLTYGPRYSLTDGALTKMSLGDIALSADASLNLQNEARYRSTPESFITVDPPVLPLAYCGDLYERLAQASDGSVLAQTALLRIRSTIQHMAVLAAQFDYSGVYLLPLDDDASEDLKRIENHVKMALESVHGGKYRTLDGDGAGELAEGIVARVRAVLNPVEDDEDAVDSVEGDTDEEE